MSDFLHHGYLTLPAQKPRPLALLNAHFRIYPGASPCDRTGTISYPTCIKSVFSLPQFKPCRATYAELCAKRADDLLRMAATLDVPIYVAWSGGVDSTCLLISLLENGNERERIIVLGDENSIREYPLFYQKVIRERLKTAHASHFGDILGTPSLFVSGECNDQLFGSDIIGEAISYFGIKAVLGRMQRELLTSLFELKLNGDRDTALFFSGLYGRFRETAPIALKTNFDLLWWINFAVKWQTVQMRALIFAKKSLTPDYIKAFYHPFYNTHDFQLWSMNNPDQRIKDSWASYKWPAKEIIFGYTKDAEYRDRKKKFGSLQHLLRAKPRHNFLDEHFAFHEQLEWYRPHNDFA
jgi:hypothetical protein